MNLNDVDFENYDGVQEPITAGDSTNNMNTPQEPVGMYSSLQTSPIDDQFDNEYKNNDNNQKDVITEFLKYSGISDPSHIKFEDEDGIVKDRDWNELSFEEKMNILTTSQEQPERDLDDEEIEFINAIRTSQLTPKQYLNTIQQQTIQNYVQSLNNAPQYSVADLSDDEIFMLDLQDKVEDITDDEILEAVKKAKEDPLYERRVAGLRKNLEEQENAYRQNYAQEQQAIQQEQYYQFRNSVIDNIESLDQIGDMELNLDNEDKEELAQFLLDIDDTGMSYFGKALNDPKTLIEMAWWTLKGRDALNSISEYYTNQIKNVRQQSYQKGLEDAKKGSSKVVYRNQSAPISNKFGDTVTIDDLY